MSEETDTTLASAYGELLALLIDSPNLDAFLDQAVMLAAQAVTPAAACGLTMRRDGRPFTVANSSSLAADVDEIQYGADEGPCLDTLRTGLIVQVDDLAGESRWPRYRPHALAHGVMSSLSVPMIVDGSIVAALNLYAVHPRAFVGHAREHAVAFTAQCAAAVTLTLRQTAQAQVQQQLGAAMASRSIIDQALGVLMGQQRCTAVEAFDLLRRASQHRNRKLRDIATDIITTVTGEPPVPPPGFRIDATRDGGW
jgi:GAF domain-containing protein